MATALLQKKAAAIGTETTAFCYPHGEAQATAHGAALGQVKTDDRSNETTAIPKLLKAQEVKG